MMSMLFRHVLAFVVTLLLIASSAFAQRTVSYQGYLTDDAGTPITQTGLAVDFALFDVAVGGSSLWAESQTVDVEEGIFTTALGQNTPFPPTLDFNEALYLELTVDGTALTPRVLLRAAPSALAIPGVHARPDQDFVGINRENRIGSEYFGVRAPVFTSGTSAAYGGMYMETAGAGSRPFYGYATDGNAKAWHYYDGNTDKWHLNVNGNRLTVLANGRVGIGTTSPENPLSVAGIIESTTGGIQFPDGTVQTSAASGGGLSLPFSGSVSSTSPALEVQNNEAVGILGISAEATSYGGSFISIASSGPGSGLYARGNLGAAPDLVLGANDSGTAGDDGILASDPDFSGSDIILQSNDRVWVQLDADQNGDTDEFSIRDDAGDEIFEVDGEGNVAIKKDVNINSSSRVLGGGAGAGVVRAGAEVTCPRSSTPIGVGESFNNVNSGTITVTTGDENRECVIDFGFPVAFYSVSPEGSTPFDFACNPTSSTELTCKWSNAVGEDWVDFMIIIY